MFSWQDWKGFKESFSPDLFTEAQINVMGEAEREIEQAFADFNRKLELSIGKKKEGWLSSIFKAGGRYFSGDEKTQSRPGYSGYRKPLGSALDTAGEYMRPRTAMERDYAVESIEPVVTDLLNKDRELLLEVTVPDMVEELKAKVLGIMRKAMTQMFQSVQRGGPQASLVDAPPQAELVKRQPSGKPGALHALHAKYGGIENAPEEEIHGIYSPLKRTGAMGADYKKAAAGLAPVAQHAPPRTAPLARHARPEDMEY
jgi:hypothetical protein